MTASNIITITGNVGGEVRSTKLPSGQTAVDFSLATNDYYRDKSGNRVQRTEWHRIKGYGKVADVLAEHLDKGSRLTVVGTMRYRKYTDKFEQTRTVAEIHLESFDFLGGKPNRRESSTPTESELAVMDA